MERGGSRKGKKGARSFLPDRQGVIFWDVREEEMAVEGLKGAGRALSLGGKVERGGSRKEKKGVEGFSS